MLGNINDFPQPAIRTSKASATIQSLRFPIHNQGAHRMLMVFNQYKYVAPGQRGLNKLGSTGRGNVTGPTPAGKTTIELPLPVNLQDSYNVRVQGYDAELSGALVAGAASQFAGAGDLSSGNIATALGGVLSGSGLDANSILSPNMGDISRNVAFLGRRSLPSNLGRAVDTGLGNTINPKTSLYFDGVNLKQLTFDWNLAPQDARESDVIRDITNTIKRNMLPTYGTAVGFSQALLNYPSTVDIFLLGVDQQYYMYFKTSMIQGFNVSYTPHGLAIVKGGKPAMVSLSMNLVEADIHTAEDYGGASTFSPSVVQTSIDER